MKYYIQNRNAGFLGNAIMFWRKGCNGYTANLDDAEIFTEEEAKKICKGNPTKNRAWSKEYIDNNKGIQRIVDCQYLDYEEVTEFK